MSTGIEKAWGLIRKRDTQEVCREARAEHEPEKDCYRVVSLGMEFLLCRQDSEVRGQTPEASELYSKHSMYFDHAVIWALAIGKDAGRTGRLVKPSTLKGGHHFFTRGTHVLPLDRIAEKYGLSGASGNSEFIDRGFLLGGRQVAYGDAAVELFPLPCLPVVIILWLGDEEFSARADLLFDSSAEYIAPIDVLWSAAMLAVEAML